MTAVAALKPNVPTFGDLLTATTELGKVAGRGRDTQVQALLKMLEGGFLGVLDLEPDKHGSGISDAMKLAEAYAKAQSGSTIFDAKAPNQRKLVSCFKKMIEVGMWPKGGPGEPLQTFNNFVTHRQKLRQKPENAKRLDDAANSVLRLARAQLKRDSVIGTGEFDAFCFKPIADVRTAEEVLESIRKLATALRDGKAAQGHALDNSSEVQEIVKLCTKRLKAVAVAKAPHPTPKAPTTKPVVTV